MKEYTNTPGNMGATIWTRDEGDNTEFLTISYWKSTGAIKNFAGGVITKAKYYPEDKNFLLKLEPNVRHYKVAFTSRERSTRRAGAAGLPQ